MLHFDNNHKHLLRIQDEWANNMDSGSDINMDDDEHMNQMSE